MKQNLKIFLLFCLIVLPLNAYAQATAKQAAPKQKISFKDLSLEDKLAQTIVVSTDIDNAARFKNAIQQGLVGGVLIQWGNYSLKQTKELIDKLQGWAASSPKKIPLLISIDYEGGTVYTPVTLGFPYLPTNMALAAAQDIEDTTTLFYIVGKALRKLGVQINFAPVIDVNINPANPIIGVRSFGSDTKTVSQMGVALINGLQKAGVVAVAKHFPGHGETTLDSHKDLPHLNSTEAEFRATHLPPFEAAIKNNVKGVMTAHIVYDFLDKNNPATFSPAILNGLLRKELGFKGIIISDSLDMKGATKGANIITAAEKSLASGVD
ncbi:MAG: glycoside hydrolase family 3 protein, partial [Elusimicrobiota bacterium]|nr:glycoside hydrolase family 3 protein [Elusimicrobiota bacterium]